MKKKIISLLLLFLWLSISVGIVTAQSYYFQVPRQEVTLYINADGSASLDYSSDYVNDSSGHVLDFLDMGLPNGSYDINSITADINGIPLSVSRSDYQGDGSGVAIVMGAQSIPPGGKGTVNFHVGKIGNMIFKADEPENYASINFTPSYYGSQYVYGSTDYTVTIYLPPGMQSEEPRWYTPKGWPGADEPEAFFDANGRAYYVWHTTNADIHSVYQFGAGFPDHLVPASVLQTKPAFTLPSIDFESIFGWVFSCGCIGFFLISGVTGTINASKRKLKYMPPKVSIEGHGVKRGLTAVQAAILMEQPIDKIMTMMLFSVVKKGAAVVEKRDPLQLKITEPQPQGLHFYEVDFLEAFKESPAKRRKLLQDMIIKLVKDVSNQMKGFSRKETIEYYEKIMEKAWAQVSAADTPEVQMQRFDEALDWTMLDKNYDRRTRDVFQTRPVYLPMWWSSYDPGYSSPRSTVSSGGLTGGAKPASTSVSLPHLPGSDFAASVVNGVQSMSAGVIGNLSTFTSGITNKTNPIPKSSGSSRSGGRSSGGGGCACACACAGCACACAGGGR